MLSRKVLSLTKPKGKIYKTKSLGHYITEVVSIFNSLNRFGNHGSWETFFPKCLISLRGDILLSSSYKTLFYSYTNLHPLYWSVPLTHLFFILLYVLQAAIFIVVLASCHISVSSLVVLFAAVTQTVSAFLAGRTTTGPRSYIHMFYFLRRIHFTRYGEWRAGWKSTISFEQSSATN